MNEWILHLYSALLCIVVQPKRFTIMCVCVGGGGGVSPQPASIYTGAGHIIRISSKSWFISLIPFKKWNLYNVYIHSTQTDIFQVFISFNFDDYNWQLMKTPKFSREIFRNLGQLKSMNMKSMSMYSTQYLVGAFAWITASMRRGMESISLWHCSGVMRAQVALIGAFSSSALLGLAYRIFLFTIPHRLSMGLRSGEFAGQLRTGIPWSLNQVLVALALCAGAKSCWKMKSASP